MVTRYTDRHGYISRLKSQIKTQTINNLCESFYKILPIFMNIDHFLELGGLDNILQTAAFYPVKDLYLDWYPIIRLNGPCVSQSFKVLHPSGLKC